MVEIGGGNEGFRWTVGVGGYIVGAMTKSNYYEHHQIYHNQPLFGEIFNPKRRVPAALALFVFVLVMMGGCSSTIAPKLRVTGAQVTERSDEAVVVSFTMELTNPNTQPLPLRDFNYSLSVDGKSVFHAIRSAELTLPQGTRSTLILPAVVSLAQWNGGSGALHTLRVSGQLSYSAPGALAEVLLDMHFPPPSTSFSGSAEVDLTTP